MKVFYVFLLVLGFGVVSSHGRTHEYNTVMPKDYDEFFLVQQWPASFCSVTRCPSVPPYFTVHGLWAQLNSGQSVTCAGNTFDIRKLKRKTERDMTKFWPNLFGQNQNKNFWAHEYNKHASCISPFQNDQEKYFSSTLKLAKDSKFGNVTTMLFDAGIHPGKHYSISDIRKAIYREIQVQPTLQCNKVNEEKVQLFQIYLCFDKTASKLQNCKKPYKDCPTHKEISFPDVPPPRCPSQSLPVLFSSTGKWPMN